MPDFPLQELIPGLTTVLVPVLNEIATLEQMLIRLEQVPLPKQVIVADGGSTDGSRELIQCWADQGRLEAVLDEPLSGKGSAVRAGIRRARGEVFIIQDGDLEYDPEEIPQVVAPLLAGQADVCYGSRVRGNNPKHSVAFYCGGRLVSLATTVLFWSTVTDEPTCYKAFRTALLRRIPLLGHGFELEPEVTAKVLRLGLRYREVPVSYHPRTMAEGKKIRWTDGLEALWTLLYWRFAPLGVSRGDLG